MDENNSINSDSLNGNGGADRFAKPPRALMLRDAEPHALSPYLGSPMGAPYFESDSGGLSIVQLMHSFRRRWLLALARA